MQHVRISKKAKEILSDRNLANKIAKAITNNGSKLNSGESISVDGVIIKSSFKN